MSRQFWIIICGTVFVLSIQADRPVNAQQCPPEGCQRYLPTPTQRNQSLDLLGRLSIGPPRQIGAPYPSYGSYRPASDPRQAIQAAEGRHAWVEEGLRGAYPPLAEPQAFERGLLPFRPDPFVRERADSHGVPSNWRALEDLRNTYRTIYPGGARGTWEDPPEELITVSEDGLTLTVWKRRR
jgi:hypothetical protein